MTPDDANRIRHMIEAAEIIERFLSGRKREDLESDQMLLFALVRAVEIIGEAASRISPATREAVASVPWAQIVAMRNRLIHACFEIDPEIVWRTVTEEVPLLIPILAAAPPED